MYICALQLYVLGPYIVIY